MAPSPAPSQPPAQVEPQAVATPVCADCVTLPKLTPVRIEILTDLGSKLSKTGDMFPIKLAYPIMIDGKTIVPAGAMGMGEVIFAKGSGGGGAGGELVLAARYVDVGSRRVNLRSLQLNANGQSRIDSANAIGVASAAAPGLAFVALFMKGKQSVVPAGTIADAKTAEDLIWSPAEIASLAAAAAAMPTTGPQAAPAIVATPVSAVPSAPAAVPTAASAPATTVQPASQQKGK